MPETCKDAVVDWQQVASEFLRTAGLPPVVDEGHLSNPELTPLQRDVAQFLLYLRREGLIRMSPPIRAQNLNLALRAREVMMDIWLMFKGASAAAAGMTLAMGEDSWVSHSTSDKKLFNDAHFYAERKGQHFHWWWTSYSPTGYDGFYVEFALSSGKWFGAEGDERVGVVWGLTYKPKEDSESEIPTDEMEDWLSAASKDPRLELAPSDWGADKRWHKFTPLAEIIDLEPDSSEKQRDDLEMFLAERMQSLVEVLKEVKNCRPVLDSLPELKLAEAGRAV